MDKWWAAHATEQHVPLEPEHWEDAELLAD
jgi:hypothetical protein